MNGAEFVEQIHETLDRLNARRCFADRPEVVEAIVDELRAERLAYETERALREVAGS